MSQETERYQLENNGNTYLVRTTASGGGADVEANPEGTATTDLTKLKVDDTIYGIPEGTNVVANPTLAGTESALTGLQVGDTKYKVPEGYEVHTYIANKTYTTADNDYQQLLADLTAGHDIKIGNNYYHLSKYYNNAWRYSCFAYDYVNDYLSNATISIEKSGDNIILYANVTRSLTSISPNTSVSDYPIIPALTIAGTDYSLATKNVYPLTTAPTADNTSGYLKIVVLSSEPATRYNGYLYIITA